MQMLHYMSYIWEEYEKTMEAKKKGITKQKDFKYPPIFPIVYYEYFLFRLQDCEDLDLIGRKDEISLIMLINKLRKMTDFSSLQFPDNYLEDIAARTTGDVLLVLAKLIENYLRNINLPDDEIYELTDKIKEGDMNRLFEHFEGYDIQKVRRESRAEGSDILLITQIHKKLERGKDPETIADEVEESIEIVNQVVEAIRARANEDEEFNAQRVLEIWKKSVPV